MKVWPCSHKMRVHIWCLVVLHNACIWLSKQRVSTSQAAPGGDGRNVPCADIFSGIATLVSPRSRPPVSGPPGALARRTPRLMVTLGSPRRGHVVDQMRPRLLLALDVNALTPGAAIPEGTPRTRSPWAKPWLVRIGKPDTKLGPYCRHWKPRQKPARAWQRCRRFSQIKIIHDLDFLRSSSCQAFRDDRVALQGQRL